LIVKNTLPIDRLKEEKVLRKAFFTAYLCVYLSGGKPLRSVYASYKTAQVVAASKLPTPRTLLPKGRNERVYTPSVNPPDMINHNYKHKLAATALIFPSGSISVWCHAAD
jgi:hypothetical protein